MSELDSWEIVQFKLVEDYVIDLTFKDGTRQLIDFEPVIGRGWMRQLKDPTYFRRVRLNEGGNLEWPDGQDFNPEALHDWPRFEQQYIDDAEAQDE
jgi:hypothetical protein